jgi:hypothetical protein
MLSEREVRARTIDDAAHQRPSAVLRSARLMKDCMMESRCGRSRWSARPCHPVQFSIQASSPDVLKAAGMSRLRSISKGFCKTKKTGFEIGPVLDHTSNQHFRPSRIHLSQPVAQKS